MRKIKFPKGEVEISSKEEVFWTDIRDRSKLQIEGLEKALKLERAIFEMAESKIKEEGD